jgi:hypothetical protein
MSAPRLSDRLRRLPPVLGRLARWGLPGKSLLFGPLSLGDDLLCSALLRETRLRGEPVVMFSNRPELFAHNPDPLRVLPIDDDYVAVLRRLGRQVIKPYYVSADPAHADRDVLPSRHIIAEMCALAGIRGAVSLRPYFFLTQEERAFGRYGLRQIAVQTSGLAAAIPYATKEWGGERFAAVAGLLGNQHTFVQIGAPSDPLFPGAVDLRGKTSLRQTAAVLANSSLFLGLEGFLAHLARAVNCPGVIVFGGRARAETFGYSANKNLVSAPPCSPCGYRSMCPQSMVCMSQISPEVVAAAVLEVAARPRERLPVEKVDLP